jgi:hypothetical protein
MPCPELQRKSFGARTRVFIEPHIKAGRTAFSYVDHESILNSCKTSSDVLPSRDLKDNFGGQEKPHLEALG